MLDYFKGMFPIREKKYRRNYEIEETLYSRLEDISKKYDCSISDFINASLERLISMEEINLSQKQSPSAVHTFFIRESNLDGLDQLKEKYDIGISKLVNIAIKNII